MPKLSTNQKKKRRKNEILVAPYIYIYMCVCVCVNICNQSNLHFVLVGARDRVIVGVTVKQATGQLINKLANNPKKG